MVESPPPNQWSFQENHSALAPDGPGLGLFSAATMATSLASSLLQPATSFVFSPVIGAATAGRSFQPEIWLILYIYHLVMTNIAMENHHF